MPDTFSLNSSERLLSLEDVTGDDEFKSEVASLSSSSENSENLRNSKQRASTTIPNEGSLENYDVNSSICFPFHTMSTLPSIDKRKSLNSSPIKSRKKSASGLSCKCKFAEGNLTIPYGKHLTLFFILLSLYYRLVKKIIEIFCLFKHKYLKDQ